jgi:hypothetical protein
MRWISAASGELYEGERREMHDQLLPNRPSSFHIWDTASKAWILAPDAEMKQEEAAVDSIPQFLFEILYAQVNDIRQLRRDINDLKPDTYTTLQSTTVSRLQYRTVLKSIWRLLNTPEEKT